MSQSLWSRDYFLIIHQIDEDDLEESQSLWSRDYFLIKISAAEYRGEEVAIPLEQGLFFNASGQGAEINGASQSLWSRDYFLMAFNTEEETVKYVAIPLEQGLFFNENLKT